MENIENIWNFIPQAVRFEIFRICASRGRETSSVSEVKLRAFGKNSIIIGGEKIRLSSGVTREALDECLLLLCEGSLYAYRDNIKEGYITLPQGVRVGISGEARYDGGGLVGISGVSSLTFRIPTSPASNVKELADAWKRTEKGMLIYSPPGVGKTTALRYLVAHIGGEGGREVAVIDERCEFSPTDYKNMSVDILRGYKRSLGMQIALRTMSPEVMVIDEIGQEGEAREICDSVNSGVKILASTHAGTLSEVEKKSNIKPLLSAEVFDVFVGLTVKDGKRVAKITVKETSL